jgi:hypothetical protein
MNSKIRRSRKKQCKRSQNSRVKKKTAPPKLPKANSGRLHLSDGRVAHKAEGVILDAYSPPKYPVQYDQGGNRLKDEEQNRREYMKTGSQNALHWIENACKYTVHSAGKEPLTFKDILRVTNATFNQLNRRPENGEEDRTRAQKRMEDIETAISRGEQDIHCFSTRVVDRDGKLLIGYFSQSKPDKATVSLSPSEKHLI